MKITIPIALPDTRPSLCALACSGILLLGVAPPSSAAEGPEVAMEPQQVSLQSLRTLLGPLGWGVEQDADGSILLFRQPMVATSAAAPAPKAGGSTGPTEEQLQIIARLRQAGWRAEQGEDGSLLLHSPDRAPRADPLVATVSEPPADADGDGIADAMDLCPATGAGIEVNAAGCPVAIPVALEGVGFRSGSADLTEEAKQELQRRAGILSQLPNHRLTVIGHTDSVGRAKSNLRLSQRRARSVRDYLASQGIPEDHLSAEGRGEAEPIADNASAEGRAKNRRVELNIEPL